VAARALGAGLLLIGMQAVPVSRTNPPATGEIAVPLAVDGVLQRACYDCHSNETRWPWYAWIAPASWLVVHDVNEARAEMNFSAWTSIPERKRRKLLGEIVEVLEEDAMPLWYYLLLHPGARLDAADEATLVTWARAERMTVAAR